MIQFFQTDFSHPILCKIQNLILCLNKHMSKISVGNLKKFKNRSKYKYFEAEDS